MILFKSILNESRNQKLVYRGITIESWAKEKSSGYLNPVFVQLYSHEEPAVWFTPNLSYAVHYSNSNSEASDKGVVVAIELNKILLNYKHKRLLEGSYWDSILVFEKIPLSELTWVKQPVFSKNNHYSYNEKLGDRLVDL